MGISLNRLVSIPLGVIIALLKDSLVLIVGMASSKGGYQICKIIGPLDIFRN